MAAIVVGLVILIVAGLAYSRIGTKTEVTLKPNQQTQTSSPTATPSPSTSPSASGTSPAPTSTPTPIPPVTNSQGLQYPNSIKVRSEGTSTTYESSDDPDAVTNWYKDQIKNLKMNAKSFVTTKTNGNVLNKLVGVDGKKEIRVEISKNSNEAKVRIIVNITTTS